MRRGSLLVLWVIVGVSLVTVLVYVAAEGPYWFKDTSPTVKTADNGRWWSQEIQGNRTAILAMLGGSLAAFGALVTYMNLRVTRRGHQTDRFAKAVELLADDKPATRLGGIYALDAIAKESPVDRQAVLNVLDVHRQGSDEHSDEHDRRAAEAVAERLRPTPRWSPTRTKVVAAAAGVIVALVATAYALGQVSWPTAGLPRVVLGVLAGVLTSGVAALVTNQLSIGRREAEQRPLFEVEEYFVRPERDGTWSVRSGSPEGPISAFADGETNAVGRGLSFMGPIGVVTILDERGQVKFRHHKRSVVESFGDPDV